MSSIHTPILFLVFNRPHTTKRVFNSIRQVKPRKLYVAADGPHHNIQGESELVANVCKIATNVDWDCEVITLFREENLGLKNAVSGAIDWFFSQEEEGIILEDDCIPDNSFYLFCQELLERYRNDTRIMAISGDNFQGGIKRSQDSYYFSRYPHCWGWATWKRAWNLYNGVMSDWPEIRKESFLSDICGGNDEFWTYWSNIFDRCYTGEIDSWAYPWTYSCWLQSGLTILPSVNLVSNIGFGSDATHTKETSSQHANLKVAKISFPLRHPKYILRNVQSDNYTDKHVFNIKIFSQERENHIRKMLSLIPKYFKKKLTP